MGLFGKLKDDFTHGGVKVRVQAPSSVPGNQVINVAVEVSASSPQTINAVKAKIKVQTREQGLGMNGVQREGTSPQTIAQVESREPFTLAANESKTVQLQLSLNGSAAMGGPGGFGGNLGGALGAVASVARAFDNVSYIYTVHGYAEVAGVGVDAKDKQPIQILPPAQQTQADQPTQSPGVPPTQLQ